MEKNLKSRVLQIRNFRNIGLHKKEEAMYQELIINNYYDEIMGNLIILIGENNVGKSNILRALYSIKSYMRDESKSLYDEISKNKPNNPIYDGNSEIKIVYKENNKSKYEYGISIDDNNNLLITRIGTLKRTTYFRAIDDNNNLLITPPHTSSYKNIDKTDEIVDLDKIKKEIKNLLDKYTPLIQDLDKSELETNKFINHFNELNKTYNEISDYKKLNKLYSRLVGSIQNFIGYYNARMTNKLPYFNNTKIENKSNTKNIITEFPKIIFYRYKMNMPLTISKEEIYSSNNFFSRLLNSIENGIENMEKVYTSSTIQRTYYENSINEAIKKTFSKRFNELYSKMFEKCEYDFRIGFSYKAETMSLLINKNNEPVILNQQSEGFRWFFRLFHYFYYVYDLKAGDIVLIDEPEAHLSIPSIRGLRNVIKEIAKDKGVTFIIATHSPFFIDIDYLDEVRIVKRKENGDGIEIVNMFHKIDTHTEADTLKQIIQAFGLENWNRFIITNPNNKLIFVEGITDYNYLIAFKTLYENDKNEKLNLSFLPIAGLGKLDESDDTELKNKIEILSKFKDVNILTDSDNTADRFKELTEGKLNIIQLKDIDPNFEEIEYLFSENDKAQFEYLFKNKIKGENSGIYSLFKNTILEHKLDEETTNNFYKVLERLNKES